MKHPISTGRPVALVVEDEPLIEMEAVDLFSDLGYDAIGARSADEAVLVLHAREDVALVFTDIEMPGTMDGRDLASFIGKTWLNIRVLITSGRTTPPEDGLLGNARFVPKPYTARHIERALATMADSDASNPRGAVP